MSSKIRRGSRKRVKVDKTFQKEQYMDFHKKKKQRVAKLNEKEEKEPEVNIREKNVSRLSKVFENYFRQTLETLDMSPKKETDRVNGMLSNLKKAMSIQKKVFVSKNQGYLVTSEDAKSTYTVELKPIADGLKYVCNCGNKHGDFDRSTCKHCSAIIVHNLDSFLSKYLTKNTSRPMKDMCTFQKMFSEVGLKTSSSKVFKNASSTVLPVTKQENPLHPCPTETDFFSVVLGK